MSEASSADLLRNAAEQKLGLVNVKIPERAYPLWLRAGTNDVNACIASLNIQRPGGLRIPYEARRILEIGAGAGYRSIALAEAFPQAQILATEHDSALRRVNQLNTLPYSQIDCVFAAVSLLASQFALAGRGGAGSAPMPVPVPDGPIMALPLHELLQNRQWEIFDTVIITPDDISWPLLRCAWPDTVRLIAVFTAGQNLPDDTAAAFPEEVFLTRLEGDYVLLYRRAVNPKIPLKPVYIFDPSGEATQLVLENITSEPWSYFPFDTHSFRLHPNPGDWPAASLIVVQLCLGYSRLLCRLRNVVPEAQPVRFTVQITGEPHGNIIGQAELIVAGAGEQGMEINLAPYAGPCRVTFSTQMAELAASNALAWAEILSPIFI